MFSRLGHVNYSLLQLFTLQIKQQTAVCPRGTRVRTDNCYILSLGQKESQVIASSEIPTCAHRRVLGGQTESQLSRRKLDASHKKAISVRLSGHAHTSENDTETNLRQLELCGQTTKKLRLFFFFFGGGGGGWVGYPTKVLYAEAPPRGPNPYPFIYHL